MTVISEDIDYTYYGDSSDNPFQFAGRENDEGTGLLFERNRYYSPVLGRYISEDPIGFAGGDVNFYARVGNNPVNYVDPLGLWTFSVGVVGNLALGGGGGGGSFINIGYSAEDGFSISITGTAQGGAIAGGGGIAGFAVNITDANNVNELNGTACQFGRAGAFKGAGGYIELIKGSNYTGVSVMGGAGFGFTANSITASTTSAIVQYQNGVISFGNTGTDSIWSYDFNKK